MPVHGELRDPHAAARTTGLGSTACRGCSIPVIRRPLDPGDCPAVLGGRQRSADPYDLAEDPDEARDQVGTASEAEAVELLRAASENKTPNEVGQQQPIAGREAADRIELHVGRDLQFVRINGTIVGGLVGVLIHAASELV